MHDLLKLNNYSTLFAKIDSIETQYLPNDTCMYGSVCATCIKLNL